jgi:hypothetical protein
VKVPLTAWTEEQLSSQYPKIFFEGEEWTKPSPTKALKCRLYLPIRCPFEDGHGIGRQNMTETIVLIGEENSVLVNCQHSSCGAKIAKLNAQLRANQWSAWYAKELETAPPMLTKEQLEEQKARRERVRVAKAEALKVLNRPLSLDELTKSSPLPVANMEPAEMMLCHLGMFLPEDLLWVASRPNCVRPSYFRRTTEWMGNPPLSSVFVSGSTYSKKEGSRCLNNLAQTRFTIFEHDGLGKEKTAALLRYAEGKGLKLAAVVDSGGKSAHGWAVTDDGIERWVEFFRALGFCPKAMRPTQPVRLAGATRKEVGKPDSLQRLLYMNRGVVPWLN